MAQPILEHFFFANIPRFMSAKLQTQIAIQLIVPASFCFIPRLYLRKLFSH